MVEPSPHGPWSNPQLEKLEAARRQKDLGNDLTKSGAWADAAKEYEKAYSAIRWLHGMSDDVTQKHKDLLKQLNLNLALCYSKLNLHEKCIWAADRVLEEDPSNGKALFRRAQARQGQGDLEGAQSDLKACLASTAMSPAQLGEVRVMLAAVTQTLRTMEAKERRELAGLFDRMARSTSTNTDTNTTPITSTSTSTNTGTPITSSPPLFSPR
eukprot:GAFH01002252.1.p2 GENE.GAFH01002252.1~~GAFH01002252.1.p2  ORF type:complete len:212 (+),score=28.24 GAFH01002252.1:39-674(+)